MSPLTSGGRPSLKSSSPSTRNVQVDAFRVLPWQPCPHWPQVEGHLWSHPVHPQGMSRLMPLESYLDNHVPIDLRWKAISEVIQSIYKECPGWSLESLTLTTMSPLTSGGRPSLKSSSPSTRNVQVDAFRVLPWQPCPHWPQVEGHLWSHPVHLQGMSRLKPWESYLDNHVPIDLRWKAISKVIQSIHKECPGWCL